MLLEGLKVVDFSAYIAGPGAAGILADWGASVIKVERPGGDNMRHVFQDLANDLGSNPTFDLDNRGKRGVVLDISKPAGRDALARLAADADVFLTNVRPVSLKRNGLDDETLRKANPRLVYAVITGYGLEGPDAHLPGFDVTAFWARSGIGYMTAPKGAEPFLRTSGVGDHTTSLATVAAILAALYERERTGQGRLVQTSLLASGVYLMGSDMAVQLKFGRVASGRPRGNPINAIANYYQSAEGRWFVHNPRGSSGGWEQFAEAAGRPDLVADERFATGKARRQNAAALAAELDKGFAALPFDEIARRLDAADLVWAPMQTPAEVATDPQIAAAGAFVEIEDGQGGTYRSPAAPARFPGADADRRPPAPRLGEHTREVLAELGYGASEIEAMFADGAAA
ncbi:CaiB/BaiF CoA-transferase family protein [Phenylobacterium sp. RIFCSPHIGHO2_01_FULL_69_31]|uniref:CaiB/BaiF CoA transferase family protein n=1 Tax=Phenylobacterium sp. RIFCSPHIGHO2_01_FULL_69_31 TaxID=1801944 RepID=UPI000B2D0471|nr:CaiB/BaiF CoA-transferase family protein [Phenylobacterium sp. RIFCSPHIGHO2_01_FULL_69_31]